MDTRRRIVTLAREHRHQAIAPCVLHRREDAQLVVDHDVTACRIALCDGIEHLLLVDVDQHVPVDRFP